MGLLTGIIILHIVFKIIVAILNIICWNADNKPRDYDDWGKPIV